MTSEVRTPQDYADRGEPAVRSRVQGPASGVSAVTANIAHVFGRLLMGHRTSARLLVLIYHRVLREPDPLRPGTVTVRDFEWQMATMASCFNVLPLQEARQRLSAGTLPARAAAVTFDDGYLDNLTEALPVLQRFSLPATVFVTTGTLGSCMWNDAVIELVRQAPTSGLPAGPAGLGTLPTTDDLQRRSSLHRLLDHLKTLPQARRDATVHELLESNGVTAPTGLMMTAEQVRALSAAGIDIGAHTVNHPILARTTRQEAEYEIAGSRETLEALTSSRVTTFAYPNGRPGADYTQEHVALVRKAGFQAAVSTARGANRRGQDPLQLRRFTPWDKTPARFVGRLLLSGMRS